MELREWRYLAIKSTLFFIVVLGICIIFGNQISQQGKEIVKAKINTNGVSKMLDEQKNAAGSTSSDFSSQNTKIVVLDAGHGGMDEGTYSPDGKSKEKEYTLFIEKRVKTLLEQQNITVYETRVSDEMVSKKSRTDLANKCKADLFISIHCNASDYGDRSAYGLETLYSGKKNSAKTISNKSLARIMLEELHKSTKRRVRGCIKRDNLYILHHSKQPTTIVEIGYMSNKNDLKYMKDKNGQSMIIQGISNGIMRALREEK